MNLGAPELLSTAIQPSDMALLKPTLAMSFVNLEFTSAALA
jgi:hypothetical protein